MGAPTVPPPMPPRGRLVPPRIQAQTRGFLMHYATYAIFAYILGLLGVAMLATPSGMVMEWHWWVFGVVEVVGFFLASYTLSKSWGVSSRRLFEKRLFWASLVIRAIAVVFLYWFFYLEKGDHMMFASADEDFYVDVATYAAARLRDGNIWSLFTDI